MSVGAREYGSLAYDDMEHMESTLEALGGVACLGGCGASFERETPRLVCALPYCWLMLLWRIAYASASRWDRWGDRECCGLTYVVVWECGR
jgi:hypothetical protein